MSRESEIIALIDKYQAIEHGKRSNEHTRLAALLFSNLPIMRAALQTRVLELGLADQE